MPLRAAFILAAIAFLVTLLMRLPARALLPLLPPEVTCAAPSGTVWSGACGQLRVGEVAVSGLSWTLHPGALLRLQLVADLASPDPDARGQARVELARNGTLAITALAATVALPGDAAVIPAGISGSMQLAIDSARIEGRHLVAMQGQIDLLQIHIDNPQADLGSFELQFVPPTQPRVMLAQLRDLNGPLSVSGVLQLLPTGSYQLDGSVAARPGASAELTQKLQILGPPDAQGRQVFSIAGAL
jgi:general secretion pathway protein N